MTDICQYCKNVIKEGIIYFNMYNPKQKSHPKCYYNFVGSNPLNIDWWESL